MNEDSKSKVIPKGALFIITEGEYDDYGLKAICRALIEIDVAKLQSEYISEHPGQGNDYAFKSDLFLNWLVNEPSIAEKIDFSELHIGAYSIADFRII